MREFSNKVAAISGAASGFGREFALEAAARGMHLALADVQEEPLHAFADELRAKGHRVLCSLCDVSKAEQVQAWADAAFTEFGAVHLLFNNAGVGCGGLLWENSLADWEWVLGVNLWGVIHGVKYFTPRMLQAARDDANYQAHIVNTASMAGLLNAPLLGAYNVSKHAVVALSESMFQDLQLQCKAVAVSVLCPYFVSTGISRSHLQRPADLQNAQAPSNSQLLAQNMVDKAVKSSHVSAQKVAQLTFGAIEQGRFYIYSHPDALQGVQERMEDVLQGNNPRDPYASAPQIAERLRQGLQA
ncbi:SDR family oxidoreductase [Massilia sp. W12]|uniref:SDR family oxidoreductase n=1 Tax=Massilia sp. W12 TaxID=3126507 RepID=UPI0030CC875E